MQTLKQLAKKYENYLQSWKNKGGKSASCDCPHCGKSVEHPLPGLVGDKWDTLTTCPHCGEISWKVATHNSVTVVKVKPTGAK